MLVAALLGCGGSPKSAGPAEHLGAISAETIRRLPPHEARPLLVHLEDERIASDRFPAFARSEHVEVRLRAAERTYSPYLKDIPFGHPTVVLETDRGTIEIECFTGSAPAHVANFVGLARRGFYDGLLFHRGVSNFVVQGGDPLGNGWGDAGWSMRAEINDTRFERGTLGMPRSAGWDTGGGQIFITHVPTPHLDGLYTAFGRVRRGLDVLDRIERGDRIVRATVRP